VAVGAVVLDGDGRRLIAPVAEGATDLGRVLRALKGVEVTELGLRRPTLDDVFLTLTGHGAEEEA
jgi:ABC-2 type transport system ATP-binding protein